MIQEFRTNGVRWLHVTKPSADDITQVGGTFPFHPLVTESIVAPTLHPFIEDFGDHLFLILHFPIIYRTTQPNKIIEVDFLITKDALITITYSPFQQLDDIFHALPKIAGTERESAKLHSGFLLYHIIDRLFQGLIKDADFLEKEVTRVEDKVFQKKERLTVEEISHARRDILDFRRPLRSQATVLALLVQKAEHFYGGPIAPYMLDLVTTDERIRALVENQKETMDILYETHQSLLSANMSQIIATLTIFSAVILPLSFLASLWGMNQKNMPLRDGPHDFWIIIGIMGGVALTLLLYFRKKRWL